MDENKKLDMDQLDRISGGDNGTEDQGFAGFSGYLNEYQLDAYKPGGTKAGVPLYFVHEEGSWLYGTVEDTYEEERGCATFRVHYVNVLYAVGDYRDNVGRTVNKDGRLLLRLYKRPAGLNRKGV